MLTITSHRAGDVNGHSHNFASLTIVTEATWRPIEYDALPACSLNIYGVGHVDAPLQSWYLYID